MMGEVRLQWWHDALGAQPGTRTGSPVADALREARDRHELPNALLASVIDAHASDLEPAPFADEDKLDAYLAGTQAALFTLAAQIVGIKALPELDAASASAGRAYGLAQLAVGLPHALAEGRVRLPEARLAQVQLSGARLLAGEGDIGPLLASIHAEARRNLAAARQHVANLPRPARVAFLPLALVEPYVRAIEQLGRNAMRQAAHIAPLQRIWRIGAAHWQGRL
jgi:phytoene synthase